MQDQDKIIQEIHHRVKNNLQTVASLLRLQMRRTSSLEAKRVLSDGINRILSIAVLHDLLSHSGSDAVNLRSLVDSMVRENLKQLLPGQAVTTEIDITDCRILSHQASSLALVINELLLNAVKHGFSGIDKGKICISSVIDDNRLTLTVSDNGKGMPEGLSPATASGLGLNLVRSIVKENLHGEIDFSGEDGTTVVISFPLEQDI
ncbi:MAG: sensor histidine kinase [bacterium]|nr:sensor histidine kinase [bacterium]